MSASFSGGSFCVSILSCSEGFKCSRNNWGRIGFSTDPVKTYPAQLANEVKYVFTVLSQVVYLSSDLSKSLGARHFSPFPLVGAGSAISCSGNVRFWGSTGSVSIGATGLMTGANNDIGNDNCALWVLEIAGDPPLGVVRLLKGECRGLSPVIQCLDVVGTGVDDLVTGVCDAGGLLPLSALSYCSSPDVKVSCLSCSCSDSDSELSGALNVWLAPL
ncbi:hypothetical protein K443DRAFT_91886 [Laccaria amethystina LaAM-08-1]|uniref:Unplaced genomic scaffold K443scaffold_28, whole genome shotgun sequence n=1 Tax=Laccaria amethystina LaAM-08-1 TaxID=1095629 RepID=A0A0C9XJ93_9AGAR|nr:hypothetical protein K443DRAFT_91886 [Laccaria amethystina LaAM-08-1]